MDAQPRSVAPAPYQIRSATKLRSVSGNGAAASTPSQASAGHLPRLEQRAELAARREARLKTRQASCRGEELDLVAPGRHGNVLARRSPRRSGYRGVCLRRRTRRSAVPHEPDAGLVQRGRGRTITRPVPSENRAVLEERRRAHSAQFGLGAPAGVPGEQHGAHVPDRGPSASRISRTLGSTRPARRVSAAGSRSSYRRTSRSDQRRVAGPRAADLP